MRQKNLLGTTRKLCSHVRSAVTCANHQNTFPSKPIWRPVTRQVNNLPGKRLLSVKLWNVRLRVSPRANKNPVKIFSRFIGNGRGMVANPPTFGGRILGDV